MNLISTYLLHCDFFWCDLVYISYFLFLLPFPLPVVVLCVMLTEFVCIIVSFVHGRPSWVFTAYAMCCIGSWETRDVQGVIFFLDLSCD